MQRFNLPRMALAKTRRKALTLRPITPSATVENELRTIAVSVVRAIIEFARSDLLPVVAEETTLLHAKDEAGRNARASIAAMQRASWKAEAIAEEQSWRVIEKEGDRHTKKWIGVVQSGANIDVRLLLRNDDLVNVLSGRSEEFNSLIRNLSSTVRHRIETETLRGIFEGRSNAQVAKSLQEIDGIGRNRARLIARDQASKLNAAMNEYRHEQAGVTHYKWKTVLDERTRTTHRKNNGRIFPWAKPPASTGHPGHEINCRCRALAVLIEDEEDAKALADPTDPTDPFDPVNGVPIFNVANTLNEPVFKMKRDDVLIRLAETRAVEQIVATARAAREFTEADTRELFEKIMGYPVDGQDIARMSGRARSSAFASTRTLLFDAIKERLEAIGDLLAHAAYTNPD